MSNDDERTSAGSDSAKAVVLILCAAVLGILPVYLWATASNESAGAVSTSSTSTTDVVPPDSTTTSSTVEPTTVEPTTVEPTTTAAPQPATTTADAKEPAVTDAASARSSTATTVPVDSASPTTAAPTTAAPPDVASPGYPTNADGTPLPVIVIFDTETVTMAGQVPTQAAKDRLGALALANSQFPDVQLVDNLVINPAVPISVGVRVIELNSARFPESSAEILPDHARQLDRVVTIMQALPNISVVVIGHADQRGDDLTNFEISDERARAVVNYLLYLGISPMRLSSRAAGENDLLTVGDDNAALALNRRTEFTFYGLLIE